MLIFLSELTSFHNFTTTKDILAIYQIFSNVETNNELYKCADKLYSMCYFLKWFVQQIMTLFRQVMIEFQCPLFNVKCKLIVVDETDKK